MWGNKCRSRAAANFCSLWTTDELKYSSRELSLFDLGESNPGKDTNRHISAILFTYPCSIRKMPGLSAVLLFMYVLMTELIWHFTALCIDMVFLEHPSDMIFMGWNGFFRCHFLYPLLHELFPLAPLPKLEVGLVLIHTLRELLWFFSLCHRKLSDQDKGTCQAWRCMQRICVTIVHYCFSSLWPPIT